MDISYMISYLFAPFDFANILRTDRHRLVEFGEEKNKIDVKKNAKEKVRISENKTNPPQQQQQQQNSTVLKANNVSTENCDEKSSCNNQSDSSDRYH